MAQITGDIKLTNILFGEKTVEATIVDAVTDTELGSVVLNKDQVGEKEFESIITKLYEYQIKTVSGEIVSITDAVPAPMLSLIADISPIQDGTPTWYGENTVPYSFKTTTQGNRKELNKIVGGSVAVNQIFVAPYGTTTATGITFTRDVDKKTSTFSGTGSAITYRQIDETPMSIVGHVYYVDKGSNSTTFTLYNDGGGVLTGDNQRETVGKATAAKRFYIRIPSGVAVNESVSCEIVDLTLMFGSTIADYVYSLESGTPGAGVAWLKSHGYFNSYVPYNAGELVSVQSGDSVTRGFNQWDEEWELGRYQYADGNPVASTTQIRCKNFIPLKPNTTYYCYEGNTASSSYVYILYYGASYEYLGYDGDASHYAISNRTFTTPEGCYYARFYCNAEYGTTYNHDISINLSKTTGTPKNGDYVPYTAHTYPIDTVTLRGIPKLSSGEIYYDGDEYLPSGTVNRRYEIVDMGTLNWSRGSFSSINYFFTDDLKTVIKKQPQYGYDNIISDVYTVVQNSGVTSLTNDHTMFVYFNNQTFYCRNDSYTDAATFKTAMSGVYLVYELATATTENATAYTQSQIVTVDGTEEFVGSPIPVGHSTNYHDVYAISGTTEVVVTRAGKNLLEPLDATNAIKFNGSSLVATNVTDGISVQGQASGSSHAVGFLFADADAYIEQTLTFSITMSGQNASPQANVVTCDENFGNRSILGYRTSSGSISFTVPQSASGKKLGVALFSTSSTDSTSAISTYTKMQLELGSTATAYEPYVAPLTITTALGQTVYGGTVDVVSGVLTVDRAMVDLGTLYYTYNSDYGFLSNISGAKPNDTSTVSNILSSMYRAVKYGIHNADMTIALGGWTPNTTLIVVNSNYTDATIFKNAMSGQQLVYELATPITYQLTPQEVTSLLGGNTVWADSGNVEVTYKAEI